LHFGKVMRLDTYDIDEALRYLEEEDRVERAQTAPLWAESFEEPTVIVDPSVFELEQPIPPAIWPRMVTAQGTLPPYPRFPASDGVPSALDDEDFD